MNHNRQPEAVEELVAGAMGRPFRVSSGQGPAESGKGLGSARCVGRMERGDEGMGQPPTPAQFSGSCTNCRLY